MKLKMLRDERAALAKEYRKVLDDAGDNFDALKDGAKVKEISAKIDTLDARIEAEQRAIDLEASSRTEERIGAENAERSGLSVDEETNRVRLMSAASSKFIRSGYNALTIEERQHLRASADGQGVGTGAAGGYTVPTTLVAKILDAMKAFGGVRKVATILRTERGEAMSWPTADETAAEGELVAENAAVAAVLDIAFGTVGLGAYKYSSKPVAVSFELLQDSSVDIESFVAKKLAERLARITNKHYTTGTGSGQPNGIVTASSAGKTAASATAITYNDLVDMEHTVDPAYREDGCSWMFNDTVLKTLKKLVDSQGRPLWRPGVVGGDPDTILNYGFTINQGMADPAANAKPILFGKLSDYMVRDVMDITLFRMTDSAFVTKGQVGFLSFMRTDGDFIGSGASIKRLTMAAS